MIDVPFLNGVEDDPGNVAIGQIGQFEIRHELLLFQSVLQDGTGR